MEHAGGILEEGGLNMRHFGTHTFVYMQERALVRPLWQCQCVAAGPLAREQRLERLPSRVAFVW